MLTFSAFQGLFKPENVAIHVGQNAFNFFTSSLGWLVASSLYQNTNSGRSLYSSGQDSYSASNTGYSPSSSSSGYSTSQAATAYAAPSSQYGAPLIASHKSASGNVSPLDLLSKTLTASSSFFNPFGSKGSSGSSRPQTPRYTSPKGYESRKVVVKSEPASIEEDIDNLSLDEIQRMLEDQERGMPTIMDKLSDAQKYRVYKKVQSAVGSRRTGLAAAKKVAKVKKHVTAPSITFNDESLTERTNLILPSAQRHQTTLTVGTASTSHSPPGLVETGAGDATASPGPAAATPVRRRRRKQLKQRAPKKVEE